MTRTFTLAAAALLLAASPAAAETAAQAFRAANFAAAARAGTAEATPASLLLACRSYALLGAYQSTEKAAARALLNQAVGACDAALRARPGDPDATLQRGIAIGYIAKMDRSPGGAKAARAAFEAVLAKRPGDAVALAAMGGWHGESVATLGGFIAGAVLGAKKGESIKFFDRAVAADARDPVIPTVYASTLLALDADNAGKARALLERADKAKALDGYEMLMQRHAREILAVLARGDIAGARATAARLGPLGTAR